MKTKYPESIKASLLAKSLAPHAPSVVELAKEFNIPLATAYTWIHKMRKKQKTAHEGPTSQRPKDKSPEAKLHAVFNTMDKTEQEQSEYCRAEGIYSNHLDAWRAQMLEGLGAVSTSTKELKAQNQQVTEENKQLKRDLNRKDKALAEVSALLILKKKVDLLWGADKDD